MLHTVLDFLNVGPYKCPVTLIATHQNAPNLTKEYRSIFKISTNLLAVLPLCVINKTIDNNSTVIRFCNTKLKYYHEIAVNCRIGPRA